MQSNLVIVESPAKAKTIARFLGADYKVMPSFGHIRDLKSSKFSIDTNTFQPDYEIPEDKEKVVSELRRIAKESKNIWLASDEDREGEAISWHLAVVLGLDINHTKRIVFHEITQKAIQNAIAKPRTINMNLVNAQQARRVLDRIVGFKLSPVLWHKIKPSLSAGRVQSVAVRLVCDREKEIEKFVSTPYYVVSAQFNVELPGGKTALFKTDLNKHFSTKEEAEEFLTSCVDAEFKIRSITKKPVKRMPAPPFMTSTLQQDAAHKLGFSVSQTMRVAQTLYEAGHITYMRTDSLNLSTLCLNSCKEYVLDHYGERYSKTRNFQTKSKGAQEAHEAIRPTFMEREEISATVAEQRLYDLIRKRTLASQMADAEFEKTNVVIGISGREECFVATGEIEAFDGFLKVYQETRDEDESETNTPLLPPLNENSVIDFQTISALQRFTQRPSRYNEATLVRKMEELGIGRPSTYAPIISTIQQRDYVEKFNKESSIRMCEMISLDHQKGTLNYSEKKESYGSEKGKLKPTDIGIVVNEYLLKEFPQILDYNFTANVEKDFDSIAEGEKEWDSLIKDFYESFVPEVNSAMANREELKVGERLLGVDPKTGRPVSVKLGRFGTMVQLGATGEDVKPEFAPLLKSQSIEDITLEEALQLLSLPRTLGTLEDKEIRVNNGRYGPYVMYDGKFYSIPAEFSVYSISLEEAIGIVKEKMSKESQSVLKSFDDEPELQVRNGRFGPYICYKRKNYHLGKKYVEKVTELTKEECMEAIKDAIQESAKNKSRKRVSRTSKP